MYGLFVSYEFVDNDELLYVFHTKGEAEKVKNEIESYQDMPLTLEYEDCCLRIKEVKVGNGNAHDIAMNIIHDMLWDQ